MNVTFNFSKLTARRMTEFFTATRDNNYAGMSDIFAATVTSCPAEWGSASDPNTYLDLPMFPTFRDLISKFVEEASGAAKN